MKYKQNIDFIFSRKHTIEFDSAWIHYLSLKERETEDTSHATAQVNGENIVAIQNLR